MLFGYICVLKLKCYVCHLERGTEVCDLASIVQDYIVMLCGHAKYLRWVIRMLNYKHLYFAIVKYYNFLGEKSDIQCLNLGNRVPRSAQRLC